LASIAGVAVALAACAPYEDKSLAPNQPAASNAPRACATESLRLVEPEHLTIGTDSPAYEPWFKNNDPTNGEGFESAVAYAIAERLGFRREAVRWTVVPFNASYAPGKKAFDFDINQISITPERDKVVDFSRGYYTVSQAVVALNGSRIAGAKKLADLRRARLGAQVGTTSLAAITSVVKPTTKPLVYNDTNDAKSALLNKQVDGIVVDLPTAFYLANAELENAKIVGQFPSAGAPEQFGMLFERGNPLIDCVNAALIDLRTSGTLRQLQERWLGQPAGAPTLS
jgi:polar amino acid transport system substrate-binding protein